MTTLKRLWARAEATPAWRGWQRYGDARGNLTLPTTGINGSTITWASSNTTVVDATGIVTRPATGSAATRLCRQKGAPRTTGALSFCEAPFAQSSGAASGTKTFGFGSAGLASTGFGASAGFPTASSPAPSSGAASSLVAGAVVSSVRSGAESGSGVVGSSSAGAARRCGRACRTTAADSLRRCSHVFSSLT